METLSPRQLAQAIGVSESSLKRWADEGRLPVSRTAGGHRRILITDAIQFVRLLGLPVQRPQVLGLPMPDPNLPQVGEAHEPTQVLYQFLMDGPAERAIGYVVSQYMTGRSIADIADHLIVPVLREIGGMWATDETRGIYCEHRATNICLQAVAQLRTLLSNPGTEAPAAVGAAAPDDTYSLPSLFASTVLVEAGWRAINLGPVTPVSVLTSAARQWNADLVWWSTTNKTSAERCRAWLSPLVQEVERFDADLVVGGQGWPTTLKPWSERMHVGETMTDLAALVESL